MIELGGRGGGRALAAVSAVTVFGCLLLARAAASFGESDAALAVWSVGVLSAQAALIGQLLVLGSGSEPRARRRFLAAFGGVALLSVCIFFIALDRIPPAVHGDVGEIALTALKMDPPRQTFEVSVWAALPGLHNFIVRTGFLFGEGLWAARFSDAALGVGAVLILFCAGRLVAGTLAGLAVAALFCCTAAVIHTFRVGLALAPPMYLAFGVFAALYASRVAHEQRVRWLFLALAGVLCGVCIQVNLAARVLPIIVVLFFIHEWLCSKETRARDLAGQLALVVGCAVLTAWPLLAFLFHNPHLIHPRTSQALMSATGWQHAMTVYQTSDPLVIVREVLVRSFGMVPFQPDGANGHFYLSDAGFFEPPFAALFLSGVPLCVWWFKDRRFGWPLIGWLVSTVMLITITPDAPAYHRGGPAAAFAALIALAPLEGLRRVVLSRPRARIAAVLGIGVLAIGGTAFSAQKYFTDIVEREFTAQNRITAMAKRIAEEPRERIKVYFLGHPILYFSHGTIRFLAPDYRGQDILFGGSFPEPSDLSEGISLFVAIDGRAKELETWAAENGFECLEIVSVRGGERPAYAVLRLERRDGGEAECEPAR